MVEHDLGCIWTITTSNNCSGCEKNGIFPLFSRKTYFLFSNTTRILKKVFSQDVSGCKNIETPASQLPKFHEISSHWWWKSVGFFKTLIMWWKIFHISKHFFQIFCKICNFSAIKVSILMPMMFYIEIYTSMWVIDTRRV